MSFPDYIMSITDDTTTIQRSANLSMIKELNAGDGLTSIGNYAFSNCYSLELVTLSKSVTVIGRDAFSNCYSLKSAVLPDDITKLNANMFYYCRGLKSISIPASVTNMSSSGIFTRAC